MTQFDRHEKENESSGKDKICLLYDRDCPVCRHFAEKYHSANENIQLVNAREESVLLDRVTSQGFNVDQGIVLAVDDKCYFSADAMRGLAKTQTLPGLSGFFAEYLFTYSFLAKLSYPVLTLLRRILLKLLGVSPINQNDIRIRKKNNLKERENERTR